MSEELVVEVQGLAHGGAMVGTVTNGTDGQIGKKAFVRGVIPGEEARIAVVADRKRHLEGRLIALQRESPDRVAPPCPYVGRCGGCDLQHMTIAAQRFAKLHLVEHTVTNRIKPAAPVSFRLLGADLPAFHYRSRAAFHLNTAGEVGFYRAGTGDVVDIERCLIGSEAINRGLAELRAHAALLAPFIGTIVVEESGPNLSFTFRVRSDCGPPAEVVEQLRKSFPLFKVLSRDAELAASRGTDELSDEELDALSEFSQVNKSGNTLLVEAVGKLATEPALVELYAGAGNFSVPLALGGANVEAVEVSGALVELGRKRAREAGCAERLTFHTKSAEAYMRVERSAPLLLLDPPRSGAKEVCERLSPARIPKVIYVSCALPTLVRDLGALVANGYRLESVEVIDMFPQTHHVETVSLLRGRSNY